MHSLKLFFLILMVIVFNVFAQPSIKSSLNVKNKDFISGSWDESLAQKIVKQRLNINDINYRFFQIDSSIEFKDITSTKRIILFGKHNEESFHFSPGYVGCAIFIQKGNKWEVEFLDFFAALGEWAYAPRGKFVQIGSSKYGIYYQWTHFVQGGGRVQNYLLMTYKNGEFKKILEFKSGYVPDSSDLDLEKKGQLQIIKNQSEYYEIKIDSRIFQFSDSMYVLLQAQ